MFVLTVRGWPLVFYHRVATMVDTFLVRGCQTVLMLVTSWLGTGWQVASWLSDQGALTDSPPTTMLSLLLNVSLNARRLHINW